MIKLHTPESLALFDRCKQLEKERDEARAAYEAETLSTAELAAENARLSRIFSVATNNNDKLRYRIDNALLALEDIRTEKLASRGLLSEATSVSAARVFLQSQREAAGKADEKPDGQAENS